VAGIEPATSRVRGEVTVVFTTGQLFVWRGHPFDSLRSLRASFLPASLSGHGHHSRAREHSPKAVRRGISGQSRLEAVLRTEQVVQDYALAAACALASISGRPLSRPCSASCRAPAPQRRRWRRSISFHSPPTNFDTHAPTCTHAFCCQYETNHIMPVRVQVDTALEDSSLPPRRAFIRRSIRVLRH
jgi:hypothetical protein